MAKRVFRFQADLRPKAAPLPGEETAVDEETRREMTWQRSLDAIEPAILDLEDWYDALFAQESLVAYNASLRRAQSLEPGSYCRDGIVYRVYFDEEGSKNIVTQPQDSYGERLSQLVARLDGTILRLSLEARARSFCQDLTYYIKKGIGHLDDNDLSDLAGYVLNITRYLRACEKLVEVEQWRQYYDVASERVVEVPS